MANGHLGGDLRFWVLVTWWSIRIVRREAHLGSEIASVVHGVGVDHDKSHIPVEDVVIV
jgi:hypothetical protein